MIVFNYFCLGKVFCQKYTNDMKSYIQAHLVIQWPLLNYYFVVIVNLVKLKLASYDKAALIFGCEQEGKKYDHELMDLKTTMTMHCILQVHI